MHSLCSGHSAPVISGVSVASNPPRRKTNGNQGTSTLAALSPRPQGGLRPMAACADRAYAFDRHLDGRRASARLADAPALTLAVLRRFGSSVPSRHLPAHACNREAAWRSPSHWPTTAAFCSTLPPIRFLLNPLSASICVDSSESFCAALVSAAAIQRLSSRDG